MTAAAVRSLLPLLLLLVGLIVSPSAVLSQYQPVSFSTIYTATSAAAPAPISFTPALPSLALVDDNVDTGVPLGFSFVFYNVSYTTVNIGANGDVQFQTSQTNTYPGLFGSADASLTPFIAFFWTDLYPEAVGSRSYATIGSAPNRQFVLRNTAVPFCCSVLNFPAVTADVILSETSNTVQLRYYNVSSVSDYHVVSIGIENSLQGGVYDYISVANEVAPGPYFYGNLTGFAYTFTPIVPFTNPAVYGANVAVVPPPVAVNVSSVYRAARGTAPAQVAFTPAGTLPLTDNDISQVPIGFNFTFYNVQYSTAFVGANGNIQFRTANSVAYPPTLGASYNSAEEPFIAFFWTDLYPALAPASRTYATLGSAPNRRFVLRYSNVHYSSNYGSQFSTPLNCDVLLYETSNSIEFRYYSAGPLNAYDYVSIGIENVVDTTVGSVPDYLPVLNSVQLTASQALSLANVSYTFFPLTPFTNPTYFSGIQPPKPSATSTVYTAVGRAAPVPVSFTPTATLPYTDNDVSQVSIGFNFTFYNVAYSTAFVGANGNIQFVSAATDSYASSLDSNGNTNFSPFIAFFFADLLPTAAPASRTYATVGTAPNRQFILRYSQVAVNEYQNPDVLTCDVILYETSNNIEFRYYSVPFYQYTAVAIGIQSGSDSVAIVNELTLTGLLSITLTGYSYLFSPITPFVNPTVFTVGQPIRPLTNSALYTLTTATAPAPVAFTPAATLPYTNDDVTLVPLGFTFTFYNVSYTLAVIGANGNIQFSTASTNGYPTAFDYAYSPNSLLVPFIAFFFADLLPNAAPASRTYATIGSAPNRRFILRYSQVGLQSYISSQTLSCDVVLYEGSNAIEMRYYSVPTFIYSYYYVDIGLQSALPTLDYVSLVNGAAPTFITQLSLVNYSYTFTPTTPFVSPSTFYPTATATATSAF